MGANPRTEQRRQSRLLDQLEGRFGARITKEIERASRDVLNRYEDMGIITGARDHQRRLEDIYSEMAIASFRVFGSRILDQGKSRGLILDTKLDFSEIFQRMALAYINNEMVRKRITSVAETTREQIVAQVAKGQDEGLGVAAIAKRISDRVPSISRTRGALIGRTETHSAANYGANEAAKETGLNLRKEWVSAEDERTRPAHAAADGQIVGMKETFDVGGEGLMYPGDPAGSAANTINCRCSVAHIVED